MPIIEDDLVSHRGGILIGLSSWDKLHNEIYKILMLENVSELHSIYESLDLFRVDQEEILEEFSTLMRSELLDFSDLESKFNVMREKFPLRYTLDALIDEFIPPFTDYIVSRNESIIRGILLELIVDRFKEGKLR